MGCVQYTERVVTGASNIDFNQHYDEDRMKSRQTQLNEWQTIQKKKKNSGIVIEMIT